jgi:hypothetical membrane protein
MASHEPQADGSAASTRFLLRWGVVAGPFYLALGLTQALIREGFDLARHPLSVLANGSWGWVQTANFVLSGLMVLAAAVGFGRVLGPKSRAFRWSLAGYGLGMILAAIFPADPIDGFPPGTPKGMPTSISTTGLMHFVAGALTFLMLGISGLAAAWTMRRRHQTALALLSLFSGLSVLIGFFGGVASPIGVAGIWFAVVIGWIWLAVMSFQLQRPA